MKAFVTVSIMIYTGCPQEIGNEKRSMQEPNVFHGTVSVFLWVDEWMVLPGSRGLQSVLGEGYLS